MCANGIVSKQKQTKTKHNKQQAARRLRDRGQGQGPWPCPNHQSWPMNPRFAPNPQCTPRRTHDAQPGAFFDPLCSVLPSSLRIVHCRVAADCDCGCNTELKKNGFKSAKRRLYIALRSTSSQGPHAIAWTETTREIRCAREQERERSDGSGYTASKAALRAPLKQ